MKSRFDLMHVRPAFAATSVAPWKLFTPPPIPGFHYFTHNSNSVWHPASQPTSNLSTSSSDADAVQHPITLRPRLSSNPNLCQIQLGRKRSPPPNHFPSSTPIETQKRNANMMALYTTTEQPPPFFDPSLFAQPRINPAPPGAKTFLDLSAELRLTIYEYAFADLYPYDKPPVQSTSPAGKPKKRLRLGPFPTARTPSPTPASLSPTTGFASST